ncbi:MAG: hypothetical protein NWE95_12145 [Candidatus Bathyarchaeota archaeon]|nr:hypothetical protein [Candidatus Bathyarchaeota archaeon]
MYSTKEELFFDVNAKIEEQKKETNQVMLNFALSISTKPNVVKYSITGSVTLGGKPDDIRKKLEVNPNTKIPQILFTIYQHVFNSIYILSSNLNTPYPPPDLLHPMAEKIQILSSTPENQPPAEQKPEAPPPTANAPTQTNTPTEATPAASASSNEPAATPTQPSEEKTAEKPAEST